MRTQIQSSQKRESLSSCSLSPPRSGALSTQSWPGFPASRWKVIGTLVSPLHVMGTGRMKSALSLPPVCIRRCPISCLLSYLRSLWIPISDKWLTQVDIIHGACNMLIDIAVLAIPVFSRSMWVTADEQMKSRIAMIGLYILGGL